MKARVASRASDVQFAGVANVPASAPLAYHAGGDAREQPGAGGAQRRQMHWRAIRQAVR
jgi:hypothetical protein